MVKGAKTPPKATNCHKEHPAGGSGGVESSSQTPFLNLDPFQ